ncbi:MAG TPA: hypothetical protein VF603_04315 [Allosphingosinicella sp.]
MAEASAATSFGRIAIFVLAIEWIVFGSMHFSAHQDTVEQVPDIFGAWKGDIVVVTGIWEVATGILILIPELRKWAAWSSLALLVVLFPAMYKILANPDAFPVLFRVALMPNNIFLAICSVYLIRNPALTSTVRTVNEAAGARTPIDWRARPVTLIVPALLLAANCAGFLAIAVGPPGSFGTGALWAMACIASGALIGFLFGVPRINPNAEIKGEFVHNQNIEAVSDWLTKILIGVGLVNFAAIGAFVSRLADQLSAGLGTHKSFATGLIVYFFVVGIIQGYILTRMFLGDQFRIDQEKARRRAQGRSAPAQ